MNNFIDKIKKYIVAFLKKSEKWTHTDMVYLAKGGFWLSLGQFITSASSFILALVFANFLPKETYGFYKYILTAASILSIFTLNGIGISVTRSAALSMDGSLNTAKNAKYKWGILAAVAGIASSLYYYFNNNFDLSVLFLFLAIVTPPLNAYSIYNSYLGGKKLFKESTLYSTISQIIAIIALIIAIIASGNIYVIITAYFLPNTILNYFFYKITEIKYTQNQTVDPDVISYGKQLSYLDVLTTFASNIDKILLWKYLGPVPLAVYSFSQAPVNQISSLLKNILPLSFPKFAAGKISEIKKTLTSKMLKFYGVVILGVAIYILLAPLFFRLFFPKYSDAVIYSQVFSLTLLFFPQKLIGTLLQAKMQKKAQYVTQISNSFVRIASLFILLPYFGVMGAIISQIIPYATNGIVMYYYYKKLT